MKATTLSRVLHLTTAIPAMAGFSLSAATLCVSFESTHPVAPYATWETAATNIQDAVDAADAGDTVLVTNGVYAVGGREAAVFNTELGDWESIGWSRVVVTNAIRLASVNGPLVTTVEGAQPDENGEGAIRCVYLGTNAVLSGFTLTNGWNGAFGGTLDHCTLTRNYGGAGHATLYHCTLAGNSGGGAVNSTLYHCTLTGNTGRWFGGAHHSTLYNCILTGNSPGMNEGGGANGCTLYNCTVMGNHGGGANGVLYNCLVAGNGGGTGGAEGVSGAGALYGCTVVGNNGGVWGTVFNSIVYYNTGGNYAEGTVFNFSCTTPLPTNGVSNITGPPLFMDMAAGDFRLREESPCIDAGTNVLGMSFTRWTGSNDPETGEPIIVVEHITDPTDMVGNTRFIDGNGDGKVAWDIGAYEFNSFRPPRFSIAPQLTADGWRLNITGAPNQLVWLQKSGDMRTWEDLWPPIFMGEAGVGQVNDSHTSQKAMFYRVVVP